MLIKVFVMALDIDSAITKAYDATSKARYTEVQKVPVRAIGKEIDKALRKKGNSLYCVRLYIEDYRIFLRREKIKRLNG